MENIPPDESPKEVSINLKAALIYIQRGWSVFPLHNIEKGQCSCRKSDCSSPGKHPRTQNGLKDATTDSEQIKQWWEQWPEANIAIRTGKESGLCVLDIDPRHGGYVSIEECDVPSSKYVQTGGGGLHHYFLYKPALKSRNAILPGVDVKSDGGYVVAPPSNHLSGLTYQWKDEEIPLAGVPDWLIQLAEKSIHRKEDFSNELQVLEGKRNTHLTSLAGSMRSRGMSTSAIEKALLEENKIKCSPPLTDSEVINIAKSIGRYEPTHEENKEISEVILAPPIPLQELLDKNLPPVEYLIEGILQKDGRLMISASPNSGKSMLSQNLVLALSTGEEALFDKFAVKKIKGVLLLDMEMGERAVAQRFKKMNGEKSD